jgi:hypothetical protein
MNPLITNSFADGRYHERVADADRKSAQARQLQLSRNGDLAGLALRPLTLPGMGVRRPHWWAAFDSADAVRVPDTCCD